MNDDAYLATGVSSFDVNQFENEKPSQDTQEIVSAQQHEITELLPTAQQHVDAINQEIAEANKLTDFVASFEGKLPTDIPAENLAAKLESRYMYINYLITRKNLIIDGARSIRKELNDIPVTPLPLQKTITVRPVKKIVEERPRGLKAIWQGICDLFGGDM